jgi:hypothetical protein
MAYRILSRDVVRQNRLFHQAAEGLNISPEVATLSDLRGAGPELDLSTLIETLEEAIHVLPFSSPTEFEAWVGSTLHEHLRTEIDAVRDRNFWLWLSLGPLREVVVYRTTFTSAVFSETLVGLGPLKEGFLCRAYLRAELVYDPNAPIGRQYRHAFVGDQDFWRSHVMRPGYAIRRDQLLKFIEFQYPDLKDTPQLATGTNQLGIRLFVKRLRRVASTTSFVFLDTDSWARLLEDQASEERWEVIGALNKQEQEDRALRRWLERLCSNGLVRDLREVRANGRTEAFKVLTACLPASSPL